MERKMKIADFAALVGTSAKTIYKQIEKNRLVTVNELQNGREIALIVTNDEQIKEFQNIYGKTKVNNGNYEDILTVTDSEYTVSEVQNQPIQQFSDNSIDKLITLNNQLQDRLLKVTDEVIESKSKQLLLEDKANREGLYLKEINELKSVNNRYIKLFISVSFGLITVIAGLIIFAMYQHFNPITVTKEKQVTKIIKIDAKGNVVSTLTK